MSHIENTMQVIRQEITANWRFTDITRSGGSPTTKLPWLPATVPGHVHLDLLKAGAIPDPFHRMNERAVAWVDETDFVYETTFEVADPAPLHAYLVFHGIDTVAEIALNGEFLGRTDNMFIPHEFQVGGRLKPGENILRVTFSAALRVGRERHAAWDAAGNDSANPDWFHWGPRSFVRKAQYMYGWDWGPEILGCGLWQKVELVTVPVARITDWKYDVEFIEGDKAIVTVTVDVERAPGAEDIPLLFLPTIPEEDDHTGAGFRPMEVPQQTGIITLTAALELEQPRRWEIDLAAGVFENWSGLYNLSLSVYSNQETCDHQWHTIGLRTIELIREPDADGKGEGFKFRVNGIDTYIKGANWIPDGSYPGRITREQLHTRITQAKDAGFNMLRIWGGGLYESEDFYDICDLLGILVWQDFPYACAYHPDTGDYAEAARIEATAAVRRIRNHPCLALWCGNNENHTMFADDWKDMKPARLLGEHLYHEVLPEVLAIEDPSTPYWPGSPYGGAFPNDPNFGDVHNWEVWHGKGDWTYYTDDNSRFCSEFGFASSCGMAAWDKCLAPEDKTPDSAAVRWHDKTRKGYEIYLSYIALHYPEAQTLEDLVYYSQLNQADALKYGVEHYRRLKGRNWGTLFWQINDCWPTHSWAVIDSEGEPKAAYFACKKFYAPVLLSLVRDGETVTAHLVSDLQAPLSGSVEISLVTFDGETLAAATTHVSLGANVVAAVATFDLSPGLSRACEVFVSARFTSSDGTASAENILLLAEPKDLKLSDPGLSVVITENGASEFSVQLSAKRFAPSIWLRRSDNLPLEGLEDNFFHLQPGETRTLTIAKNDTLQTVEDLHGRLVARTL